MSCSFFVWTFLKSLEGGNLKKSLLAVFLLIIMLLSGTLTAYAEGSGNVDGGGGGLNQGTKAYNWPGNSYQGGRVTVVRRGLWRDPWTLPIRTCRLLQAICSVLEKSARCSTAMEQR